MDLKRFTVEDLILAAAKSEVESRDFYAKLASRVRNFLLKERLNFLSTEEERHRAYFENMFKEKFPGKKPVLPAKSPVPLPELRIETDDAPVSELFTSAMQAEKTANQFYTALADRLSDGEEVRKTVLYIAAMEMGHYRLLETERENADKYESFNMEWPMTHVGP